MGAVAWGLWPTLRFPFPLIEPDVPASGIRLSDWLHRKAHDAAHSWQAFQAQHSALPMQHFEWEPVVAAGAACRQRCLQAVSHPLPRQASQEATIKGDSITELLLRPSAPTQVQPSSREVP